MQQRRAYLAGFSFAGGWPAGASSVGLVRRQSILFDRPLHLRSGATLRPFTIAYETYGALNAARSNVILICHALSGDGARRRIPSWRAGREAGWWMTP